MMIPRSGRSSAALLVLLFTGIGLRGDEAEDQSARAIERSGGRDFREGKDGKPATRVVFRNLMDEELKGLKGPANVQVLDRGGNKVADEGLKKLKGFLYLQFLTLFSTQVTDNGLKVMKDYKALL